MNQFYSLSQVKNRCFPACWPTAKKEINSIGSLKNLLYETAHGLLFDQKNYPMPKPRLPRLFHPFALLIILCMLSPTLNARVGESLYTTKKEYGRPVGSERDQLGHTEYLFHTGRIEVASVTKSGRVISELYRMKDSGRFYPKALYQAEIKDILKMYEPKWGTWRQSSYLPNREFPQWETKELVAIYNTRKEFLLVTKKEFVKRVANIQAQAAAELRRR